MKFSVIIPAYNAGPYICKTINSVLTQTIEAFEILVIDDGSIDDTAEIVKSINDPRIRYFYQPNAGVSVARNKGIRNARGEYICFLDADDLWKPNHLEVIQGLIKKFPQCNVYLTGHEILLCNNALVTNSCFGVKEDMQNDNLYELIWRHGHCFNTNSIACKANVFDKAGLFEIGVKNAEDDDMWYRLFAYYSVAISSQITSIYVRANSSATMERIFVEDWVFLSRVQGIMESPDVSDEKKKYLCRLLEQRKLSFVRHCILNGDKKSAWMHFRELDKPLLKKRKYIETLVALIIPSSLSNYFVSKRDKQYYGG